MTFSLIMEHMFLVLAAITMSILIGIPLGVCAYMTPKSRGLILKVVDILADQIGRASCRERV